MNVLTVTGHLVTDPVGRDTPRGVVCDLRHANIPVIAQCAGGS